MNSRLFLMALFLAPLSVLAEDPVLTNVTEAEPQPVSLAADCTEIVPGHIYLKNDWSTVYMRISVDNDLYMYKNFAIEAGPGVNQTDFYSGKAVTLNGYILGGVQGYFSLNDDDTLSLIEPNTSNTWERDGSARVDALETAYPDRILARPYIVQTDVDTDGADTAYWIDLGSLLVSLNSSMQANGYFGGADTTAAGDVTWDARGDGSNVALRLYSTNTAGTNLQVNYNVATVYQYTPRVADDRVGYFTTVMRNWSKNEGAQDLFDRHINRWDLEPDASGNVKYPIVMVLDAAIPDDYKGAIRDGILEWNKAFDAIGLHNAIKVRNQESWEWPSDGANSFVSWTVQDQGYAIGLSTTSPYTGQILRGHICIDEGWLRALKPQFDLEGQDNPHSFVAPAAKDAHGCPGEICSFAEQAGQVVSLVDATTMDQNRRKDFLQHLMKAISMHEMGHVLGLRHNFKGSAWLSMADIEKQLNAGDTTAPLAASIMDYTPAIFSRDGSKYELGDQLGPYDYLAIEYGYTQNEERLAQIGPEMAQRGIAYATDEDIYPEYGGGIDVQARAWDISNSPLDYAKYTFDITKRLVDQLKRGQGLSTGDSYANLRGAFITVLIREAEAAEGVASVVGSQRVERVHFGDGKLPLTPVSAEEQRDALTFLLKTVFDDKMFAVDPEFLQKMIPSRNMETDGPQSIAFNYRGIVAYIRSLALSKLISEVTYAALDDREATASPVAKFSVGDMLSILLYGPQDRSAQGIFSGVFSGVEPSAYQKNLQEMTASYLIMASPYNAASRYFAEKVLGDVTAVLQNSGLALGARIHYAHLQTMLDAALHPK